MKKSLKKYFISLSTFITTLSQLKIISKILRKNNSVKHQMVLDEHELALTT